jgi:hypothetical protein
MPLGSMDSSGQNYEVVREGRAGLQISGPGDGVSLTAQLFRYYRLLTTG